MLKKLGLLALSTIVLGSPLLGFASANTVDGYSSSSDICKISSFNYSDIGNNYAFDCQEAGIEDILSNEGQYFCVETSDIPYYLSYSNNGDIVNVSTSPYCFYGDIWSSDGSIYFLSDPDQFTEKNIAGTVYISHTQITAPSAGGDSSDGSIGVPSGFTDSVNGLVSNFAGSIGNYAPTLIIVGLGVVLLFTFWGVIRSWAVRIFNRKGR